MLQLKENQILALKLLATYKYLVSSQFVKLGLYKKRAYLTNSLKSLVDMKRPLLAKYDFNPINGKLESLYYLTNYGKQFLIEECEYSETQIKSPKGSTTVYLKDYFHRKMTVQFHIHLQQYLHKCNGEMIFLNYYFDKTGNNRSKTNHVIALNRIMLNNTTSFIPDINAKFMINGKEHLLLFEQHNGNDAKRLFEQLYIHITAMSEGSVDEKYNIKKAYFVIIVCEYESVKTSVIKRLQQIKGIESYDNFFLFKTDKELEENFNENWSLIDGKLIDFSSLLCKFK